MDIELFDKRYVYLEWSDELEGKDCILAKSYKDLKDFVNSGDESRFCKVNKGREKPFTNGWSECDFCYFDNNLKVKKAWIEGKTIQVTILAVLTGISILMLGDRIPILKDLVNEANQLIFQLMS